MLLQTALTPFTQKISALALIFANPAQSQPNEQTEALRDAVLVKADESPSKLLKEAETEISRKKELIENAEEKFKEYVTSFYRYFWHSEQRLIHFLTDSKSEFLWNVLADNLEEQEEIQGAFLHLHSRYNYCQTCRCTLVRSAMPGGVLRDRIENQLSLTNRPFFFHILASFRVHYGYDYKNERVWMPYNIDSSIKCVFPSVTAPYFYLKKLVQEKKRRKKRRKKMKNLGRKKQKMNFLSNSQVL